MFYQKTVPQQIVTDSPIPCVTDVYDRNMWKGTAFFAIDKKNVISLIFHHIKLFAANRIENKLVRKDLLNILLYFCFGKKPIKPLTLQATVHSDNNFQLYASMSVKTYFSPKRWSPSLLTPAVGKTLHYKRDNCGISSKGNTFPSTWVC